MKNDLSATKSNDLVDAKFFKCLNSIEMRILNLAISQLNPLRSVEQEKTFYFSVKDFLSLNKGISDHNNAYKKVKKAIVNLSKTWVSVQTMKGFSQTEVALITKRSYSEGEGRFMIEFHEEIMPYLANIKNNYTSILLETFGNLKSEYSLKLYEVLSRWLYKGKVVFSLQEIEEIFNTKGKYKRFNNFKIRVLTPSINEINEKTNLSITEKYIKIGRSIQKIEFSIFDKSKALEVESKTIKRPKFPAKNKFGSYVKLDRQSPRMSSSQYADYAQACLVVLDDFYQDIESVKIEDVRNYYVFLSVNASFKSKIFTKKSAYEEIQKRGYKLVNCELVKE